MGFGNRFRFIWEENYPSSRLMSYRHVTNNHWVEHFTPNRGFIGRSDI